MRSRLPVATSAIMWSREKVDKFIDHPMVEWTIFGVGVIFILLSPLAGAIPGPGGIFVFAIGLAMVLKTSMWAKRRYVLFKRWQPKAGRWADWGLRRRSALRREARRKRREEVESQAAEGELAPQTLPGQSIESPENGAHANPTPVDGAGP